MSAALLRLIACAAMLLDHIGFMVGYMPFRIVGRIAFPIFLYLICNGYRHTASTLKYALRLGLFALISQVPFSLMSAGRMDLVNWNIFFTLLLSLLAIWAADKMLGHRVLRWVSLVPALVMIVAYQLKWIQSDYGARAIVTVMAIYLLDRTGFQTIKAFALGLLVGLVYYLVVQWWENNLTQWTWIQLCSLAAIPMVAAYNGQKGGPKGAIASRLAQWGFYLFYPAHLLALWLLF